MKSKIAKIICIIIPIFVILGLITSYIDSARLRNAVEPKYTIKIINGNGSKITYWGLGYKIIRYPSVSPNEPYKNNRGVKYGNWFMKYEPKAETTLDKLNEINNQIIKYFTENNANEYDNFSYNYIDEENNLVVVGLLDNSEEKQEEFKKLVIDSNLIKFEKGKNINY